MATSSAASSAVIPEQNTGIEATLARWEVILNNLEERLTSLYQNPPSTYSQAWNDEIAQVQRRYQRLIRERLRLVERVDGNGDLDYLLDGLVTTSDHEHESEDDDDDDDDDDHNDEQQANRVHSEPNQNGTRTPHNETDGTNQGVANTDNITNAATTDIASLQISDRPDLPREPSYERVRPTYTGLVPDESATPGTSSGNDYGDAIN